MPRKSPPVRFHLIGDQGRNRSGEPGSQRIKLFREGVGIGVPGRLAERHLELVPLAALRRGEDSGAPMGCISQGVLEPRVMADAHADAAREVLGAGECLEVVVVYWLVDAGERVQQNLLEQLRMPAEPAHALGDRAVNTPRHPRDLAMRGAVDDSLGDRDGELGALEKIARGEALQRETVLAGAADEVRNHASVALSGVGPCQAPHTECTGIDPVLDAVGTRAKRRLELIRRNALDRNIWPVHSRMARATAVPLLGAWFPAVSVSSVRPPRPLADGHRTPKPGESRNHYAFNPLAASRISRSAARPARTTTSGTARTSASVVRKFTMQARRRKRPPTTAFETKISPSRWSRTRISRLRSS